MGGSHRLIRNVRWLGPGWVKKSIPSIDAWAHPPNDKSSPADHDFCEHSGFLFSTPLFSQAEAGSRAPDPKDMNFSRSQKLYIYIYILLVALGCAFQSQASTDSPTSAWSVSVWQSEGLPDKEVVGLAQTPDGYLWAATSVALVRFDGVQFEDCAPSLSSELHNRSVRTLLSSREGALWLATVDGRVIRLDHGKTTIFTDNLLDSFPVSLIEDAEGAIWVTYRQSAKVTRIKNDTLTHYAASNGLPGEDGCVLAEDRKGRLWFAAAGQVGILRGDKFETLLRLPKNQRLRLAMAKSGGIWICSSTQLLKYDLDGTIEDHGVLNFKGPQGINALLEDSLGGVWIGTSYAGLLHYNGTGFESIPTSNHRIFALLEDRENNIWIGTGGGGINRIQPQAIAIEGSEVNLASDTIQSACEDTNGVIWAATANGLLVRRTGKTWDIVSTSDHWLGDPVSCVAADHDGGVWLATIDHKLYCRKDGHYTSYGEVKTREHRDRKIREHREGRNPEHGAITTLVASKAGDVWIGEERLNSIQCLRHGELIKFPLPEGARHFQAMEEDVAGNIWVGSANGTLLKVTGHELAVAIPPPPGLSKSINYLYASPDGSLWIAYYGGGIGRLKDGHFGTIGSQQGLYDDNIAQITADNNGWLWFCGDRGIFKVRQQQLEDVAEGRAARVQSVHYGKNEGAPSLQANFYHIAKALHGRDGRLWFPMGANLAVISPNKLSTISEPVSAFIRRMGVDGKTVALYGGPVSAQAETGGKILALPASETVLALPPGPHMIDFEFTALSFKSPENVQFQYRLEGFDENWINAGSQRSASYARLPAGEYLFRVKACNSDGVWNEKAAAMAFFVGPFFWQTWWFWSIALAAFTLAVVALVRYVSFRQLRSELRLLEQQVALDKERSRIARDLHDDLGSHLTKIVMLSELSLLGYANPDEASKHAKQISQAAREVIKSLDETVWRINPRNDTLQSLIDYIGQSSVDFLRVVEIQCHVDFLDSFFDRPVSAAVRHNLLLVVKEALHNVVRHASASEVWLRIKVTGDSVGLSIEDNGRGFGQIPNDAGADGLRNMRQRMEEIGGTFCIQSQPGRGTQVSLAFTPNAKDGHVRPDADASFSTG